MTSPADVDVNAHLGGTDPVTGNVLTYQAVPVLARTIYSNYDGRQPFYTNYGSGNVPNSAATYDAVTGASLNTSTRHIDPYGNVAELHKVWNLLWYWLIDGAPTNMGAVGSSTNRIPLYITLANQLRDWPVGFVGAAVGEPTTSYPVFPPSAATPLDNFMSETVTTDAARARAAFHNVPPVVHHHRPKPPLPHPHPTPRPPFVPPWPVPEPRPFGPGGIFTPQAGLEHYAAVGLEGTENRLARALERFEQRLGIIESQLGLR